ncbi:uncharacterized protein LOC107009067 [Solanum pennellii]|uniref:Uncharacterized protein LOC107009067 n=1 Tax=Solanum pennellii TaxID=28526 RepID=A0ABM1FZI4_SOLPN|nr:uncharacterized protein LOC107009067 [Solanum pennellii]
MVLSIRFFSHIRSKKQAGLLLEELWAECEKSGDDKLLEIVRRRNLLHRFSRFLEQHFRCKKRDCGLRVFVISDAVALVSSIVSIIMFLSILTSRYAEDDFLMSLPAKLFFGITALFVSIVSMLLAFTSTFFLVYSNLTNWEPKLIAACACIPVGFIWVFPVQTMV